MQTTPALATGHGLRSPADPFQTLKTVIREVAIPNALAIRLQGALEQVRIWRPLVAITKFRQALHIISFERHPLLIEVAQELRTRIRNLILECLSACKAKPEWKHLFAAQDIEEAEAEDESDMLAQSLPPQRPMQNHRHRSHRAGRPVPSFNQKLPALDLPRRKHAA